MKRMKTLEETQAFFENDLFATEQCGIRIVEATESCAKCVMPLGPQHMNANHVAQGGAVFTLCDTAFGAAANAGGTPTVSMGAQISFLRPGTGKVLTAEARLVSGTRSTCLYRVEVFDDKDTLVAFCTVNGFRKPTAGSVR